jgi:aminoglycoside phosphotransferase (APT) family kinase protein
VNDWEREIVVDAEAVRRAAGATRWRLIGTGWDSDAWLADESTVWRVPRRHVGAAALRREAAVMPLLAPHLPAPVPIPVLIEVDGLPVLARHRLIPGVELAAVGAIAPEVGAQLARFLLALHDPRRIDAVRTVLPEDPLGRGDPARRLPGTHRRLDEIAQHLDVAPLRPIVDAAAGPALPIEAVCHGDLHPRHALVASCALSGVIDWGDCCLGPRALDLAIVTALPAAAQESFFSVYGEVDARAWRHARLLGVTLGAALLAADPESESGVAARSWLERLARSDAREPGAA